MLLTSRYCVIFCPRSYLTADVAAFRASNSAAPNSELGRMINSQEQMPFIKIHGAEHWRIVLRLSVSEALASGGGAVFVIAPIFFSYARNCVHVSLTGGQENLSPFCSHFDGSNDSGVCAEAGVMIAHGPTAQIRKSVLNFICPLQNLPACLASRTQVFRNLSYSYVVIRDFPRIGQSRLDHAIAERPPERRIADGRPEPAFRSAESQYCV